MRFSQPSSRRLLLAWGLLTGLTITSLLAGLGGLDPATTESLGSWSLASVLLATALKAREILRTFLNLRASTPGWRAVLAAFIVVILGAVAVGQLLIVALPGGG